MRAGGGAFLLRGKTARRCLYLCKDRHFSYKIRCIMPIFRIEGGSTEV